MVEKAFEGGKGYRAWLGCLAAVTGCGFLAYLYQLAEGLGITGLSRDVSWGLYIANFTFFVGVAASAVMVVIPYYLHDYRQFRHVTVLGEFLAVAAVLMSILFVFVDLGQPARVLNVLLYPSPRSLLFWDMIVLSGYLLLNAFTGWYSLDSEAKGQTPPRWVKPLVILSIPWAVSIHTVTAFIYLGLGARPLWHTALLAPRFLASAFASGPALLILLLIITRRVSGFDVGREPIARLSRIVTYAFLTHIFFQLVEFFFVGYGSPPEESAHFEYLFFGLDGRAGLVPWMWISAILTLGAALTLLIRREGSKESTLVAACVAVFVAVWIEKGIGLIVPGFIPAPLGEITEYAPTFLEALITLGVWSLGFLVLTVLFKVAVEVKQEG